MLFSIGWFLLIGLGAGGTMLYTDHLRAKTAAELSAQTQSQINEMKAQYDSRFNELQTATSQELAALQTKVDKLNELLAFAKDSMSDKTDNSNQLYTQLEEVRKQLDELKSNLDVLK
ncbi:hypothetical protein ACFQWB_00245 [Paenibacillus thermoaerophilus]|uniref:Uncharacterized protein n=1 Tax=Paenibacillus thermoaerophilus TaxID=1215385 RepID=A0ABW2V0R7_9BACL|nr:hypothetical protein [Paenibacillus thermoaerophilus]TMV15878.1 hypothetical protein FE781_09815 [Paenibacillus thermoaerophilus]